MIRFVAAETYQVHIGQPVDPVLDGMPDSRSYFVAFNLFDLSVGLAVHQKRSVKAFEIAGSALDLSAQVTGNILTVKSLLAPLAREEIKIVRCLGLNYADHAVNLALS